MQNHGTFLGKVLKGNDDWVRMLKAPIPKNESARLDTLNAYRVLDTFQEEQLDEITRAVSILCDCKIALISLIDKDRQWFKSKIGLDAKETPRDISYCGHAIMGDDLFIVEDAELDERFCDNPLFLGEPHVRFYAGAPLIAPNGHRIGTLCVIDAESKTLDEKQKLILKTFSKQIISMLETKKYLFEIARHNLVLDSYQNGLDAHAIIARTNPQGKITYVNEKFCEISQYSASELIGQDHRLINSGVHGKEFFKNMWNTISKGNVWRGVIQNKAKDGSHYWVDTIITPMKDGDGNINEYMAFRYDITAQREKEFLLEETQRTAHIGGWDLDPKTFIMRWTNETYRIHEVEIGTPIGPGDGNKFYVNQEGERFSADLKNCIEKGISFDSEFEFLTAKGNKKWVHKKGVAEKNKDGTVRRVVGTIQDITEKKLKEIELKSSKDYLDLALEGAGLGIWDWNLIDNSVKFDTRWAEMLGLNIDEIPMELSTWESRVHPDDLKSCFAEIKAYMDGKSEKYESVHRMKHRDGQWVYILDRGRFSDWDKEGKPIRFTGTHLNITQAKEKESELSLVLEGNNIGIWKYYPVENKLVWDKSMYSLYDMREENFSGAYEAWVSSLHPDSKEQSHQELQDAIAGIKDFDTTFKILTPKQKIKYIKARALIERDETGRAIMMIGVNTDFTKEYDTMLELNKQTKILQHNAKLASIGELAAGVGHEINNPLAIVKGYLSTLERKIEKGILQNDDLKTYLNKINLATDRIIKIVQGLRTFSRSDSSEISEFSPLEAIEESFQMINEIYQKDGINISFTKTLQGDHLINGNRGKFQQVLMNLISNARDATIGKSNRAIELSLTVENRKMIIKVKDNGCGIPEALKEKIFDPFFTTKEVNKGTGIGLSLAQNFVKELNGTLSLESKENEGAIFKIEIPVTGLALVA